MYILPNVLNKLENIKSIKQDINRALINQGQNMNNALFKDFPEKVDNLKCNLSYVKFKIRGEIVNLSKDFSMFKLNLFTSTEFMFADSYSLTTVPNFDTSNVTNMSYMFQSCANLTTVPNFNTSNVIGMSCMFHSCYNLTEVPDFDTSKVTNISYMFYRCYNLTEVPNFDTSNVTNMSYMFQSCINLTTIPQFNTFHIMNLDRAYTSCNNLSDASIQNIINMCLNSNITKAQQKNLSNVNTYSPFYGTIFNSSYYTNRLTELTAAGWTY